MFSRTGGKLTSKASKRQKGLDNKCSTWNIIPRLFLVVVSGGAGMQALFESLGATQAQSAQMSSLLARLANRSQAQTRREPARPQRGDRGRSGRRNSGWVAIADRHKFSFHRSHCRNAQDFKEVAMIKPGQKIQIARVLMNLNQQELAKKMGVRPATVSLWETEQSQPQRRLWKLFETLCELNGVSFTASGMPIVASTNPTATLAERGL